MVAQLVALEELREQTRRRIGADIEAFRPDLVLAHSLGSLILPFHLPPLVPDHRVVPDVVVPGAVQEPAVADALAVLAPGQGKVHHVTQKR